MLEEESIAELATKQLQTAHLATKSLGINFGQSPNSYTLQLMLNSCLIDRKDFAAKGNLHEQHYLFMNENFQMIDAWQNKQKMIMLHSLPHQSLYYHKHVMREAYNGQLWFILKWME